MLLESRESNGGRIKEKSLDSVHLWYRLMKSYEVYTTSVEGRPQGSQPEEERGFSLLGIYLTPRKVEEFFARA